LLQALRPRLAASTARETKAPYGGHL